jgi:hypothetical protein
MPAVHMLADSSRRMGDVKELRIFDEEIFLSEVYEPILARLGVSRRELRRKTMRERCLPLAGAGAGP